MVERRIAMSILKSTFNQFINYIVSWLDNARFVPRMDIAMPPVEIGFVYLELSNDIESFYSASKNNKQIL